MKKILTILLLVLLTGCQQQFGAIPENLQLKVPKEQVIDYTINDEVVRYAYKSRLVEDKPNEIVSKRTFNARHFKTEKPNQTIIKYSVGRPYYKDQDEWYRVEVATTTEKAFNSQMELSGEPVFGADYSIIAGADDGIANPDFSSFGATQTSNAFGNIGGTANSEVWFRFQSIVAGQGDNCTAATIEFITATNGNGTDLQFIIAGVDEDDHVAPTDYATWATDHGIHTTAVVHWDFADQPTTGNSLTTDDFEGIIDELFARGGWATGQDIGIHIDDDSSAQYAYREVASYENETYTEPVLSLTVEAGEPPAVTYCGHTGGDWYVNTDCYISANTTTPGIVYIGEGGFLNCIDGATISAEKRVVGNGGKFSIADNCKWSLHNFE